MVRVPVSYAAHGLVEHNGKLYQGYRVPKPLLPKTHELVSMGVGLEYNCRPPQATMCLRPKSLQA